MPTYEYICRACEHRFERFQKMSDRPVTECPDCGRPEAERQISAGAGLVFKGPGFYATDYRKGPVPSEGAAGGEATKRDAGKSETGGGKSGSREKRPDGGKPKDA